MKKMVKIKQLFFVMMLFLLCLTACGKKESIYEYGTFSGDIENKFELVEGSASGHPISGMLETVYINYAKTTDGGLVAWKDSNYAYTSKSDDSRSLCSNFALHFDYIEPLSFD